MTDIDSWWLSLAEFSALNDRLKERENRRQFATARFAAAMCSTREHQVDPEIFLPFPPPPKFLTVDAAQRQLEQWVKQSEGTIIEKSSSVQGSRVQSESGPPIEHPGAGRGS